MALALALLALAAAAGLWVARGRTRALTPEESAALDRHRLLGTAHYENRDFELAIDEFRAALAIHDREAGDWANLGLALCREELYQEAETALERARRMRPDLPQAGYGLGLVYLATGRPAEAQAAFERILVKDPTDAASYYHLGSLHRQAGRAEEAHRAFEAVARHDPDNAAAHYQLFTAAREAGRMEEAGRELAAFNRLRGDEAVLPVSEGKVETGRYAQPVSVPRASFTPWPESARAGITFHEASAGQGLAGLSGRAAKLADLDGDGDLDLLAAGTASGACVALLNGGSGRFAEPSELAGPSPDPNGIVALAVGDWNNDALPDLFLQNGARASFLLNEGGGRFRAAAGLSPAPAAGGAALFFDLDHDGDLDLFAGGGLYRNLGDSTFAALPDSAWGEAPHGAALAVALGDADDDDDTDIAVAWESGPASVFLNERRGRFRELEAATLPAARALALGDVDNDGALDLVLAGDRIVTFSPLNRGPLSAGRDAAVPADPTFLAGRAATALQLLDFDNDGLLDLLVGASDGELALLANHGAGAFRRFGANLLPAGGPVLSLDAGDVDGDGDLDILTARGASLHLVVNEGGEGKAGWLAVEPAGVRVSRQAIGARVELRCGASYQRRDVVGWPVHFGLGQAPLVDVLRITWTNGIVQNEVALAPRQRVRVEEIVRADASCPFLFTFDGAAFRFVNDILGVAAMGVPFGESVYHVPDPDEYVRIRGNQLRPTDGRYLVRLPEELKEITYLDEVRLIAVDHPADTAVFPNERFSEPPFVEPGVHTARRKLHARRAWDHRGREVSDLLAAEDGRYPADFTPTGYDGLVEPHALVLDLGSFPASSRVRLHLTGWIYWSSSSVNVAVSQNQAVEFEAVSLAVADGRGGWTQVSADIGLPNGKNTTITVDLTGRFPAADHRVRLSTNMVLYWDEIFFTLDEEPARVAQTPLPLLEAALHYRGFSALERDASGRETFDYASVERHGPWKQVPGWYTRYGDVRGLLEETDDRYVVYGAGEEVALVFDANAALPPRAGWTRDFFFYAFGWLKDSDPNTAFSQTVGPLPFRGMPATLAELAALGRDAGIAAAMDGTLAREATDTVGRLTP